MEISQHVRAILSFAEAADAGSFAAAARRLEISPAAVSKNIAALEQVLGVRLMNRTTRHISLTEEGHVFLEQAKLALGALENAVDSLSRRKLDISGHVRLSTSHAFGYDQLMPTLPGLYQRYPGLSLEIDFDDRIRDLVSDGYDIVIRGGNILDSNLIARPIFRIHTLLVASPAYLQQHGTPHSLTDLQQHRLIARRFLGGKIQPWTFRTGNGNTLSMTPDHPVLTLTAPDAIDEAAAAGLGIAQVGVHHAIRYLRSGQLKQVMADQHDPGSLEMVIQYPHRALIAPRVKVTVDYLLECFQNDPQLHIAPEELEVYRA